MCFLSTVMQYCGLSSVKEAYCVADKLFMLSLKSVIMVFRNLADMYSRNVYDFSYEQKAITCGMLCTLFSSRGKCVVSVSLRWPRFLCANYVT